MNLPTKTINKATVSEYRKLDVNSYSSIKEFIKNRNTYYKKYILKEYTEDKPNFDMVMGSLIDNLIFTPLEYDEHFAVTSVQEPKPQMLDFCNILYRKTLEYTREGIVTKDMQDLLMDTYLEAAWNGETAIRFKGKTFEKVIEMFQKDGEAYYEELRKNTGKEVISLGMLANAEKAVDLIKNNFVTYELFTKREGVDVYQQEPIEFEYRGIKLKCLPDHFEVHHNEKIIKPYDLKCTWQVEEFAYNYIKNRYDIQNGLYNEGIRQWAKSKYPDYIIEPMRFITVDATGVTNPLIHETTYEDMENAFTGYEINGKRYIGINEAIDGIKWANDTSNWSMSKEAFEQKGIMKLNINYDKCHRQN